VIIVGSSRKIIEVAFLFDCVKSGGEKRLVVPSGKSSKFLRFGRLSCGRADPFSKVVPFLQSHPIHQIAARNAAGGTALAAGVESALARAEEILDGDLGYLGDGQLALRAICPRHDVADRQTCPGSRCGAVAGVVLAVEVLRLHGGQSRCVLKAQVADARQVISAPIGPKPW